MKKFPLRLSLVLPAYNEEENVAPATIVADGVLRHMLDEHEILIVDDGSTDGTAEAIARLEAEYPAVRGLRHPHNRGYGEALRTGFAAARLPLVAFTDSDRQFDLVDLERLLPLMADHDIAVGYRLSRLDPWPRIVYSRVYNLIIRLVFGLRVRDLNCALKVMDRAKLQQLVLTSDHYFINVEMLVRARQKGFAIAEAGVKHLPRAAGSSKVHGGDVRRALQEIARLRRDLASEGRPLEATR